MNEHKQHEYMTADQLMKISNILTDRAPEKYWGDKRIVSTPSPIGGYEALAYAYNNGCQQRTYLIKCDIELDELHWLLDKAEQLGILEDGKGFTEGHPDNRWKAWNPLLRLVSIESGGDHEVRMW